MGPYFTYLGSFGEHATLAELLKRNFEAYLAIKSNQKDYDITTILDTSRVLRIQVKSTYLQNKGTNNSFTINSNGYDLLVIVVVSDEKTDFYVMTREQALNLKGDNVKISVSTSNGGVFAVKECFSKYKNKWELLNSFKDSVP